MKTIQKKICLLGDFAVGKTSLVRRFVEERFDEKYLSTIGISMSRKTIERADYLMELFIWDLAGGEDFSKYGRNYLRGATGALVVCDLTQPETLGAVPRYVAQLRQQNPSAAVVLLANKVDLETERLLDDAALSTVAATIGDEFLLTSAKTGANVSYAFQRLADRINNQ